MEPFKSIVVDIDATVALRTPLSSAPSVWHGARGPDSPSRMS